MLILSRRVTEIVDIFLDGKKIAEVILVDIQAGGKAQLGFRAGDEVTIHRREVTESKLRDGSPMDRRPAR